MRTEFHLLCCDLAASCPALTQAKDDGQAIIVPGIVAVLKYSPGSQAGPEHLG